MAANFRTCKGCGKIFQSAMAEFCDQCAKEFDDKFVSIRNYLYDHPDATVVEVVENTQVEEKIVLHFLKEGRLEMKNATGLLTCEKCGKPIATGRLCDSCKKNMSQVLNKAIAANRPQSRAKAPDNKNAGKGFKSDFTKSKKSF